MRQSNTSVDQRRIKWLILPDHLQLVADRFRIVVIEDQSWQGLLRERGKGGYDSPDTFFFMDPPYLPESREAASRHRYADEMSEVDHEELLQRLVTLKGKAMLCGYASPLYDRYLAEWNKKTFTVTCATSHGSSRPQRVEIVWMNY